MIYLHVIRLFLFKLFKILPKREKLIESSWNI